MGLGCDQMARDEDVDANGDYDLIWPRGKRHYLFAENNPMDLVASTAAGPAAASPLVREAKDAPAPMVPEDVSIAAGDRSDWVEVGRPVPPPRRSRRRAAGRPTTATRGTREPLNPAAIAARTLALQAFVHGAGCALGRVAGLLRISRRTLGRSLGQGPTQDGASVVEAARRWITTTIDHGGTDDERHAALAWLANGMRPTAPVDDPMRGRQTSHTESSPPAEHPMRTGLPVSATAVLVEQATLDELQRLLQRIRRRSLVVGVLLETPRQEAVDEAMKDLVDDITSAASRLERALAPLRDVRHDGGREEWDGGPVFRWLRTHASAT